MRRAILPLEKKEEDTVWRRGKDLKDGEKKS